MCVCVCVCVFVHKHVFFYYYNQMQNHIASTLGGVIYMIATCLTEMYALLYYRVVKYYTMHFQEKNNVIQFYRQSMTL